MGVSPWRVREVPEEVGVSLWLAWGAHPQPRQMTRVEVSLWLVVESPSQGVEAVLPLQVGPAGTSVK